MKLLIVLFTFLSIAQPLFAKSMRRCVLLPISDDLEGAISYQVFEEVELYLKESSWCYYRSNSEILNIFNHYKKNLKLYLENREVLKTVATKVKAGSLIKVDLQKELKGIAVSIKVFGENGRDIYFKEQTKLDTLDIKVISQTVVNWLEVYQRTIPYKAKILGVLGPQFSIDSGIAMGIRSGDEVEVYRPEGTKRHPLLKEIVEWKVNKIATAKIFHASENQAQGKILEYEGKKKVRVGDWIQTVKQQVVESDQNLKFPEAEDYKFGKLGTVGLSLLIGKASYSNSRTGLSAKSMAGWEFGLAMEGELWVTRNWFGKLELGRSFVSYSKEEGNFSTDSNSATQGHSRVLGGYRYLPLGFFYGPRVDGLFGYASYQYGMTNQTNDGIVAGTMSGVMLGLKGDMPVYQQTRLFVQLDFLLGASYTEDVTLYGEADSASNFNLELGGSYAYSPSTFINSSFLIRNSKAKYQTGAREIAFKDQLLKVGMIFTF